jgi:hypothetical protein
MPSYQMEKIPRKGSKRHQPSISDTKERKIKGRSYAQRNILLERLGFLSYADYLKSHQWSKIRRRVLKRAEWRCEVCGQQTATSVHHRSYRREVLLGHKEYDNFLVATCVDCHRESEYSGGVKTTLTTANARMRDIAARYERSLPGLCASCRVRDAKKGSCLCGKCGRPPRLAALDREYLAIIGE